MSAESVREVGGHELYSQALFSHNAGLAAAAGAHQSHSLPRLHTQAEALERSGIRARGGPGASPPVGVEDGQHQTARMMGSA